MDQSDPQIGKYGLLQSLRPCGGGFHAQFFVFFYRGTDHEALMAFRNLLADESVDPGTVGLVYQETIHRLSSRGQFVDDGNLQITVHQKRQRPGNGGGGHDQKMGICAFGRQSGALGNTEAMLLVGDHQTKVGKNRGIRQQRVGTHHHLHPAVGNGFPDFPLLLHSHRAGEQRGFNAQRGKELPEGMIVLLCQNFRRCHHGSLPVILYGAVSCRGGYHGLAAAYITLYQPIHRGTAAQILQNFLNGATLCAGEPERQHGIKRLQIPVFVRRHLFLRPGGPQQRKTCGKYEKFLEDQPFFCHFRFRHGLGFVDGIVGTAGIQNAVFPAHRFRQDLRRNIADAQSLPYRLQNGSIGKACCQRINGQHPTGGHRLGFQSFEDGICHIVAYKISGNSAVENVFSAVLQLLSGIFAVKEGQSQPGSVVCHLHTGQIQALTDMGSTGGVHDHGFEAGRNIRLQLVDGDQLGAIFIASGEVTDEIPQSENIQLGKLLCLGRADAF